MGLTKQYLRYAVASVFNIVGSNKSNVVFLDLKGTVGKYCAVGACEHVFIWDLRTSERIAILEGSRSEVTIICKCPDKRHLAVGYSDGIVKIFDLYSGDVTVTFSGHKSAVSALNYDKDGIRLVSGAKDTEVIVWDVVNECGLFRLKGHKGMITQACFTKHRNILITSSKDTLVKFWDMDTQHCFKTLVGHRTEVYDFVLVKEDSVLITGSADSELRVYHLTYSEQEEVNSSNTIAAKRARLDEEAEHESEEEESDVVTCSCVGSVMRQGRDRVVSMETDPTERVLGCHGSDSTLELFRIHTDEEMKRSLQKREKKARKRAKESEDSEGSVTVTQKVEDEVKRISTVKTSAKLRSFDCLLQGSGRAQVVLLLANNMIEMCHVDVAEKNSEASDWTRLTLPAHRTDVRTLCFSSDNTAVLSGSAETVKVWNRASGQCIRTMTSGYALCSLFAPGDRHIVIGTKSGKLQVFDIAAGTLLETVDAHSGAVWSICLAPDKRSIVSGSADHEVKFWDFELISDESYSMTSKRLSLVHTRTLKMSEDVLCVKYSPDQKLLAVSLLDNTVKVFFSDTLKFFLSLYGHKLPVLCMDISSDSTLLVTGSADRNVKLWGLDFGDCHKSIFAHDDSIMCVQFVSKTHLFFTGGKDNKLKQWNADTFEHITTLNGHHAEIWCLAISPSGNFVVTGSHDKSLRLWEKTHEPLVLEEEQEMAREQEYEDSLAQSGEAVIAGETNKETGIAGKKTVDTVKAAEKLMEAIEVHKEETAKLKQHQADCKKAGKELPPPNLNPLLLAFNATTPDKYVLEVIKKVKSSELEEALLVLPFSYVTQLLAILNSFIENGWSVELSSRCLFFLLRIHQGQITSNQVLLPIIDKLKSSTKQEINEIRDTIGFNMAGLQFLKRQIEEKEEVTFFVDATDRFKEKKKKAKKKAILTIKT